MLVETPTVMTVAPRVLPPVMATVGALVMASEKVAVTVTVALVLTGRAVE